MKKTLFAAGLALSLCPAYGQYEKILADPTVTWAAEIELTLTPDEDISAWPFDSLNTSAVLKTVTTSPDLDPYPDPPNLNTRLFDALHAGRWPVFADAALTRPLSLDDCLDRIHGALRDTIVDFDPETFEEKVMIVFSCWGPGDLKLVRVRQLLVYRDKTAQFELRTLAIAPVLPDDKTAFWFAVPDAPARPPRLSDPDIVWARRLKTRGASLDVATLQPIMGAQFALLPAFLDRVGADATIKILDGQDWKPVMSAGRESLFSRVDTVVTFDPETYAEQLQIAGFELNIKDVRQLRLVQDWYWHESRQRLIVRLVAVAPMIDVLDEQGEFRYSKPMFYRAHD